MPRQMPGGNVMTQTRTFTYSGAYLVSSTNPENGDSLLPHNTDGSMATKLDAKGQTLTYAYDSYGRVLTVSLAGVPSTVLRTYTYDTNSVDNTYSQNTPGLGDGVGLCRPALLCVDVREVCVAGPYMASGGPSDPQSWNRYAYVLGDPVNFHDPNGRNAMSPGSNCGANWMTDASLDGPCANGDGGYDDEGGGGGGGFTCPGNPGSAFMPGPNPGQIRPPGCTATPFGDYQPPRGFIPTCEEELTSNIASVLMGTPMAGEAGDFVRDAQAAGLNPLLLAAVAWAETHYGRGAPAGTNNGFGLMHAERRGKRTIGVINRYSSWNGSIVAAAATIQFIKGNVTVSLLYSGQPGAYCFDSPGYPCSIGEGNVESVFRSLGGGDPNNYLNLLWPCPE